MTENKKGDGDAGPKAKHKGPQQPMPSWTHGLRQLYDEVVDEDLPDSFRDLLARLDKAD